CLSDGGGERRLDSARAFAALVPAARAGARGGRGQARGPGSEPRVLRPEGRRRHVRPGDGRWAVRSSDLGRPPDRGSTEAARGAPRLAEAAAGVERRGGRGGGARRPGGGAETRVKERHPNGTLPGPEVVERSLRQTALPAGPDPDPGLAARNRRGRMGPGGLRGLQILRSDASGARGGFDSHAFPPLLLLLLFLGAAAVSRSSSAAGLEQNVLARTSSREGEDGRASFPDSASVLG